MVSGSTKSMGTVGRGAAYSGTLSQASVDGVSLVSCAEYEGLPI